MDNVGWWAPQKVHGEGSGHRPNRGLAMGGWRPEKVSGVTFGESVEEWTSAGVRRREGRRLVKARAEARGSDPCNFCHLFRV